MRSLILDVKLHFSSSDILICLWRPGFVMLLTVLKAAGLMLRALHQEETITSFVRASNSESRQKVNQQGPFQEFGEENNN